MDKYFKVKKEIAARGGFTSTLRTEVDKEFLLLSGKDMQMIDLTQQEKLEALGVSEYVKPKKTNK